MERGTFLMNADIKSISSLVFQLKYSGELHDVINTDVLNMPGIQGIFTALSDCQPWLDSCIICRQ